MNLKLPQPPPQRSAQWFRLADLRPQLHSAVRHDRMVVRGQVWQTLVAADGRRSFRLNAAAWSAVARCDGQHTVQQLWAAAQAEHGSNAPTQDGWLQMLSQLHTAGLLSFDRRPDFGDAAAASSGLAWASAGVAPQPQQPHQSQQPQQPQQRQHLLAWRVSLGNPDALLARLAGPAQVAGGAPSMLTRLGLLMWLLLMAWAAVTALLHAGELARQLRPLMSAPSNWGLAWLAYPLMKLLHEGAHGWVARRCGAVVADWGVTWLMFMPVPYVDASAASALPRRRQRLAVSAAGIAMELSLAALACIVALNVQAGAVRDGALLVFYLALGSSLLVNANPLLRFDGYHMLCDAFGLPNLALRSHRHWLQLGQRHLLRSPERQAAATAPGEAPWLWLYAPAALVMRWLVAAAVVLWLGSWSQPLGQLALALFAWTLLLAPALRLLRWLHREGGRLMLQAGRGGQFARAAPAGWLSRAAPDGLLSRAAPAVPLALLAAAALAVAFWPLPVSSVAQGVLWLPEHALVRAQTSGFVTDVWVADGQTVQAGDPVLTLRAPALQAEAERLQGRLLHLQAEQEGALRTDAAAAAAAAHALQAAQAEWAQTQQRLQRLTVRAQAAGLIAISHSADLPGRYVQRGQLLAHVITGQAGIVKLALAQDQAARLPAQAGLVQVLAADDSSTPRVGRWLGAATGALAQLPSAALGSRSGGRIGVDVADPAGLRPLQAVVLGEVQLQGGAASHIGQRVLVRFEQGHAPLLVQAARAGQQLLLRHFNPAG